ncbi:trehalose-phosphatase [Sphingomonas sp. SUN019]|uniref:trehalose-phosphatase n=1 Tax=Sphingomonas sp. SUN019 TaxID=2937788 RepID=UPI002164CBD6|nr:trehalose-phosphatase [Sphingomonas sp. SUN019]UVO49976.1 trehalose-phosphatase [Sphingomonas sp. SUN019]
MLPPPPANLLEGAALFLDFDGTLVDLAPTPDLAAVDERLATLIAGLATKLNGRIAIISGRPVAGILALFGDLPIAIAGSHGLEVRGSDGALARTERPAALNRILAAMHQFTETRPGLLVEAKPLGAALHYRTAPAHEADAQALASDLAAQTGLHLQTGKMMVELRVGGADKGSALRRLMETPAMAGAKPVFIGDDDTDEPAMVAAAALGGAGILVGAPRPTAAAYRLPDVAATLDWLETA